MRMASGEMTATSDWDGKFKITEDYHRKNATITVYLNEDKGHYTHEFNFLDMCHTLAKSNAIFVKEIRAEDYDAILETGRGPLP